ncbi:MAG: metallophosphatase family protein [Bacillota bacterium]|nr:metallophosphatase family protein [Bacillota bacterium]
MKIAVLSDIHGNLTALNAVLNHLDKQEIDKFIIAGDHIVDCPEPNEVLEKIEKLNAYVIKGNREDYILNYHKGLHDEWSRHKQMAATVWTYNVLDKENLKYIEKLPEQLNIYLPGTDGIRVVHGSPTNINEEIFPDKYPERIEKALNGIKETVLICGHTHQPWSRTVYNKLIVNPGSVGVSFNKDNCAEYAVLTWEDNKWTVSHHQAEYDLKKLEQLFFERHFMEKCRTWSRLTLQSIKKGENITLDFVKYVYKLSENMGYGNSKLVPDCIWDLAEELWFEKYDMKN